MSKPTPLVGFLLGATLTAQVIPSLDIPLKNWPAPLYWQPSPADTYAAAGRTTAELRSASPLVSLPTGPLFFVATTPCRVVDTRTGSGFPPAFGPPGLTPGPARSFPIQSSSCTIPSTAQAYSFNVTVVPPGGLGYLTLWPQGLPQPNVVTLDDITGDIRNNAAIVPAGTPSGGISAVVNNNTDLVIDINGYYVPDLGNNNAAFGLSALSGLVTGCCNTASGDSALVSNTAGSSNTATGNNALAMNTTGNVNTAIGTIALANNTAGSFNIGIGFMAGMNIGGSNNIDIGNQGMAADNGTIRVGTSGMQTTFFAAGIRGVTLGNGIPVLVDTTGQLGTMNSSRRFKEDIHDMGDASSGLLRLRPVTYRYRKPYPNGSKPVDYGLIAEEVLEVYPDLVVQDEAGQIETVQYHKLIPMLLNELQKDHETIQSLETQLTELRNVVNGQR